MMRHATALFFTLSLMTSSAALAAPEEKDFVEFAGTHCRAFVGGGHADMRFALGKAQAKFSQAEAEAFNRAFAEKIIAQYNIDPAKGCVLDVVSRKPVREISSKPQAKGRHAKPETPHEITVVAGGMGSKGSNAPVSVAYRFERIGESPWTITNITLNGQPLVDRYREEYESYAAKGGSEAVMERL